MSASTGPALACGVITAANELVFAPLEGRKATFNWRIIPATGGLALALAGLDKITPGWGTGLAWLCVAAVLIVPFGSAPTPIENASAALGFAQKVT